MKKSIIFFTFISTIFFANAQNNEEKCHTDADNITKLIESKKFTDAEKSWNDLAKKCYNLNEQFYKNGEIIFEYQKEMSNTFDAKKLKVAEIISVLNKFDTKFPLNKNQNGIKKAIYLSDYKLGTNDEIFNNLDIEFKNNKADFKNPQALYLYFDSFLNQFKEGKKGLTTDDLYNKNIEICQKIENDLKSNTQKELIESLKAVKSGINSLLGPYITCDNLKKYCNNHFETNQNNEFWLTQTSEFLFAKNCYNDPIVGKITQKSYDSNPSSKAAFYLGYMKLLERDSQKSTELFNEAADKQLDKTEKAKIYYTIATVVYGFDNRPKAAEYLQKTIEADTNYAKAYLYLAQLYENASECFVTEFDKKAIYWLVAETVLKAGKADKLFEKSAQLQADKYLKKAPTNQEIELAGLKSSKNYSFKCWINQTIEIPKN